LSLFLLPGLLPGLLLGALACAGGASAPSTGAALPARAAATRPPSEPDVRFVTGMIAHHAQALEMARLAPTHGAGSAVRIICERILVSQAEEIAAMQGWLRKHGQPVPAATDTRVHMTMGGMQHDMLMPGMLTDEQMAQLDAARAAEFDRLFLTLMIQHHEGALTMVDELLAANDAAQDTFVYKTASDIWADQDTEIERMVKLLSARP
jgi:uncharacterized protein (DUF305 family)